MDQAKIKIIIRQSTSAEFEVEVPPKATVAELKDACAAK